MLSPEITTIAGTGKPASSGDGGPAIAAGLRQPTEARMDTAGNIYIADLGDHRVRKVDTAGMITTFAGTGAAGYGGDGGLATAAALNQPHGLCFDSAGTVYIADSGNSAIRKVDARGIITTVAGTGTQGFSGDNGIASAAQLSNPSGVVFDDAGNLLISDSSNHRIRRVDGSGIITTVAGNGNQGYKGDSGPAIAAELSLPSAIAIGLAGDFFFADSLNNVIRRIDRAGQIATVAGNGITGNSGDGGPALNAELNSPNGVALDSAGNLYISDSFNYLIRKVDLNGNIFTVGGNGIQGRSGDRGPAGLAELTLPELVNLDNAGNLIFAEAGEPDVRKITLSPFGPVDFGDVAVGATKAISLYLTVNGTVTITSVQATGDFAVLSDSCPLSSPLGADSICELQVQFAPTQPGRRLFPLTVAASGPDSSSFGLEGTGIRAALAFFPGIVRTIAGNQKRGFSGDGGPAIQAELNYPFGLAVDSAGNVYFGDANNKRIRKVDTSGTVTTIAGTGAGGDEGQYGGDNGPATLADLGTPLGAALDNAGNLYFSDGGNNRIRKIDQFGIITTIAGNGTLGFSGDGGPAADAELRYAVHTFPDNKGNIFIADTRNNRIRKVDVNGVIKTVAGNGTQSYGGDNGPATSAALFEPSDVVVDTAGNLFIADTNNGRVRKVDTKGIITTIAGTGYLAYSGDNGPAVNAELTPRGLALDDQGNLYIADYVANRIRKVDSNGVITTVAGGGEGHSNGDGGPATSAVLDAPQVVTVDSAGSLYTADWDAWQAVRKVDATASALTFGTVDVGQMSSPQILVLSNIGNAPLNFPLGSSVPSNFQLAKVGNDCATGILAVGASCNLGIVFAPMVAGSPLAGTMYVFNNALNSPQQVALTGTSIQGLSPTTVALSVSPSIVLPSESFVITTAVSSTYKGRVPTGVIVFKDAGVTLGTVGLDGSGAASFVASNLTLGQHSFTSNYAGDAIFSGSSASVVSASVAKAATSSVILSSATQVVSGTSVSLMATVAAPLGTKATPTGTVTFLNGANTLATAPLDASGAAIYATTSLPDGANSISAAYPGDGDFLPSTTTSSVNVTVANFKLASPMQSITIAHGGSGTFPLTLSGDGGFNGTLQLTCTSATLKCAIAPTQVTIEGMAVATATVTIHAPGNLALSASRTNVLAAFVPAAMLCVLPAFRRRRPWTRMPLALLAVLSCAVVNGCGGSSFTPLRERITISADSGAATRSQVVMVIVR